MNLRTDLLQELEAYLRATPANILDQGRACFEGGNVRNFVCVQENYLYMASVRDGRLYTVRLEFSDSEWEAECSCSTDPDCRHTVATMFELRRQAIADRKIIPLRGPAPHPLPAPDNPSSGQLPGLRPMKGIPQPPRSPLYTKLTTALGRELQREEADFVRRLQVLHDHARFRGLSESDLRLMAPGSRGSVAYGYWNRLEPWPEYPRDDFQFWLFIAWELKRRKLNWPMFMDDVTDFSVIEPALKKWERDQEVARWSERFRGFASTPESEPAVLELRLVVLRKEARLQWRTDSAAAFGELKQTHAKRIAEQFEQGDLVIAPDSLPLWSATYRPYQYESWWVFKYSTEHALSGLNRLLRLPLPPERVVTAEGHPLIRESEPLRLKLTAPENGGENYVLELATADGSPPPPILCTLDGRPALYLTDRQLFHGPAAEVLDAEARKTIPAEAVETSHGLRYLLHTGVSLPPRLEKRVRKVPLEITVSCNLQPIYPGSPTEDISISIVAKARGTEREEFTPEGWAAVNRRAFQRTGVEPPSGGASRTDNEIVVIPDRAAQKHFPRVLAPLGLKWDGYPPTWKLRLSKKSPELFASWIQSLPPELEVQLDSQLATLRDEPVSGTVSLDIEEAGIDWFDLKVALSVADTTLTPDELKLLLNAKGGYVRLGKKGWRRLQFNFSAEDDEQLARLGLSAREFSAEPQRFHVLQLADGAAKRFLGPDRVETIQRRAGELKTRVSPDLPSAIKAEMRPYQTEGFHFLAYLTSNRFGGVLADDMGLGKTLQTLAWLAWLREANSESSAGSEAATPSPSLVVCPKSVMDNWRAEAERFYPGLQVRVWRGEPAAELTAARESSGLVVVNYAQLRALSPEIAAVQWLAVVLDEAQYIKNPDSQTAQAARALKAGHRLALTGTPIENRLLDLWSIFGFAMPGALGNRAHFLRRFDVKDDPLARRRLAARVRPFLLRRTKSQVAKDLPDRVEEDLLCEMEGAQLTLYRAELKRARQMILGLKTEKQLNEERFSILTSLLRLRQICCHPGLVDAALVASESAKVSALEDLLEPLIEEGHKVLVFSQFVTMLDLLRKKIEERQWPHFYLAGDTENRGELVREFQSAKGAAAFLISLKAGGFGLNLTAASYVVLFDPWWNPAVENQAIDRTHRIGQTSKVMAYRLLMRDSIEQKIRSLQKQKAALADDVLGEERFAQSLTLDDLRFLFSE